eukprot:scaffold2355_cov382-Prasinococcus_capsulatus_cf.AAC.3
MQVHPYCCHCNCASFARHAARSRDTAAAPSRNSLPDHAVTPRRSERAWREAACVVYEQSWLQCPPYRSGSVCRVPRSAPRQLGDCPCAEIEGQYPSTARSPTPLGHKDRHLRWDGPTRLGGTVSDAFVQ